jgi:branched-chain amino acid transport system substrate-binding protein
MNKNQKIWVGLVVILVVAFVGWRIYVSEREGSGAITIGLAVSQTGDAADWGEGEFRIATMMIADMNASGGVNGQQINLVSEDTNSTGVGTVDAVQKLINIDHAQAIIGPTWADSYEGGLPIAEQSKVVLLTPSAAIESIANKQQYTYTLSTFWPQEPQIDALDGFMVSKNMKTLAIINDHDPFDTQLADNLQAQAETKGITNVDREQVPIDQNDFRTEILKIKALKPDALFIEINNVAGLGPFMQQVRQLGLTARIFTSSDAQNVDAVSKFGTAMEGLTYPFLKTPSGTLYESFVSEYQAKYNSLPSTPSAICTYNAVTALIAVLKQGARTGTQIRDALYAVNVPGIGLSQISFTSLGGISEADFEMRMIHDGKFVTITN